MLGQRILKLAIPAARSLSAALSLLVVACSDRPETPEYFQKVTGIALCQNAEVINKPTGPEANAGVGVVYSVELQMDGPCERSFLKEVDRVQSQSAIVGGPNNKNEWIEVKRIGPGRVSVLYTG